MEFGLTQVVGDNSANSANTNNIQCNLHLNAENTLCYHHPITPIPCVTIGQVDIGHVLTNLDLPEVVDLYKQVFACPHTHTGFFAKCYSLIRPHGSQEWEVRPLGVSFLVGVASLRNGNFK